MGPKWGYSITPHFVTRYCTRATGHTCNKFNGPTHNGSVRRVPYSGQCRSSSASDQGRRILFLQGMSRQFDVWTNLWPRLDLRVLRAAVAAAVPEDPQRALNVALEHLAVPTRVPAYLGSENHPGAGNRSSRPVRRNPRRRYWYPRHPSNRRRSPYD